MGVQRRRRALLRAAQRLPVHAPLPRRSLQRPTIDEILAMPWVQSKFIHLPPELHGAAAGAGARDDRALLGALLQASLSCAAPA